LVACPEHFRESRNKSRERWKTTQWKGKITLAEHFSIDLNNTYANTKGEESRNGIAYARDIEKRLLDSELCLREMDRAGRSQSAKATRVI
jgi:hypothetical protein